MKLRFFSHKMPYEFRGIVNLIDIVLKCLFFNIIEYDGVSYYYLSCHFSLNCYTVFSVLCMKLAFFFGIETIYASFDLLTYICDLLNSDVDFLPPTT